MLRWRQSEAASVPRRRSAWCIEAGRRACQGDLITCRISMLITAASPPHPAVLQLHREDGGEEGEVDNIEHPHPIKPVRDPVAQRGGSGGRQGWRDETRMPRCILSGFTEWPVLRFLQMFLFGLNQRRKSLGSFTPIRYEPTETCKQKVASSSFTGHGLGFLWRRVSLFVMWCGRYIHVGFFI